MPATYLSAHGGWANRAHLDAAGVTGHRIWQAIRVGEVVRVRRGVYCLPELDEELRELARLGGVISCASAADVAGLPVLARTQPHVTVPRGWSHARSHRITVHRRDLDERDRCGSRTSLVRTIVDCARELPLRDALVIADAALRAGVCHSDLRVAATAARGPGAGRVRQVVDLADIGGESPIESCLRLIALDVAAKVELQVWVDGVGRVDMLLDGWLVVEADGFAHHSSRESYRNDRRRSNAVALAGYELLRFSYEDVVHNPAYVVETLRRVLARGPR